MFKKTVIKQMKRKGTDNPPYKQDHVRLITLKKDNWPIRRVLESRDHHNANGSLPDKITSSPKCLPSYKHSSYIQ